jgi:hypothetical protein
MVLPPINYLAVLIAAIANMVIGMFWYSQMLFAKPWMSALGKTEEEINKSSAGPKYVINTIASIILAYVLSNVIAFAQARTVLLGIETGLLTWIGFAVTLLLPVYLFESRPIKLYFIYIGYQLISFIVMGIILAIWV